MTAMSKAMSKARAISNRKFCELTDAKGGLAKNILKPNDARG